MDLSYNINSSQGLQSVGLPCIFRLGSFYNDVSQFLKSLCLSFYISPSLPFCLQLLSRSLSQPPLSTHTHTNGSISLGKLD